MSKYVDGKENVDIDDVEEEFEKISQNAMKEAKGEALELLAEIKYYNSHTLKTIERDTRKQFMNKISATKDYTERERLEMCAKFLASTTDLDYYQCMKKVRGLKKADKDELFRMACEKEEKDICAKVLFDRKEKNADGKTRSMKECLEIASKLKENERKPLLENYYKKIRRQKCEEYLRNQPKEDKGVIRELIEGNEEEEIVLNEQEIDGILNKMLDEEIKEATKKDIAYDLLTAEQIKQLVELFYQETLKRKLVEEKQRLLDFDDYFIDTSYEYARIDAVEDMTEEDKNKKKRALYFINKEGKNLLKKWRNIGIGFGAFGALAIYASSGSFGLHFGQSITAAALFGVIIATIGTAFGIRVTLPLLGAGGIVDFLGRKTAIKVAKENGVYDLILDEIKANKELMEYAEQIGVAEFIERRSK